MNSSHTAWTPVCCGTRKYSLVGIIIGAVYLSVRTPDYNDHKRIADKPVTHLRNRLCNSVADRLKHAPPHMC